MRKKSRKKNQSILDAHSLAKHPYILEQARRGPLWGVTTFFFKRISPYFLKKFKGKKSRTKRPGAANRPRLFFILIDRRLKF